MQRLGHALQRFFIFFSVRTKIYDFQPLGFKPSHPSKSLFLLALLDLLNLIQPLTNFLKLLGLRKMFI